MKFPGLFIALFAMPFYWLSAQESISLDQCMAWAKQHHPINAQKEFLQQKTHLQQGILKKNKLPQFAFNVKGGLQSETIALPFDLPFGDNIDLPLYNVRASLHTHYQIFDGGMNKAQRELTRLQLPVSLGDISIKLYDLKVQVAELFFGILLKKRQLKIIALSKNDLKSKETSIKSGVENGVLLPSDALQIERRLLQISIRQSNHEAALQSLTKTLSELTGHPLDTAMRFQIPQQHFDSDQIDPEQLPSFKILKHQKDLIAARNDMTDAKYRPKLSAFLEAGIGYPNPLNFFEDALSPFAIAGIQLNWPIFNFGKAAMEKDLLEVRKQQLNNQSDILKFQIELEDIQLEQTIEQLDQELEMDEKLIELQKNIVAQSAAQLSHGVLTSTDYLTQFNTLLEARLLREIHEIQLHKIIVEYKILKGQKL